MLYKFFPLEKIVFTSWFHTFIWQLAGILEPNDGTCHLNGEGYYTEAEVQVNFSICVLISNNCKNMFSFIWYLYNNFFFTFQLKPNLHMKQDYPSIGQIIQKAKENNINIIFVIGGNSSELNNQQVRNLFYDKLATLLPGGTPRASELSTDARNILDIVSANYRVKWWTLKLMKKI